MNSAIATYSAAQERAFVRRINRAYDDGNQLRICAFDSPDIAKRGRFYLTDDHRRIVEVHVDPIAEARALGVSVL